jgi:hypothetical protein
MDYRHTRKLPENCSIGNAESAAGSAARAGGIARRITPKSVSPGFHFQHPGRRRPSNAGSVYTQRRTRTPFTTT